nr:DUF4085 family protein [Anoxybacillus tepidamans]
MYATENGFALHVLFDMPLMEWTIEAENVKMEIIV